ncbi:uncharacterized protein [Clytia hemisphaerica]|uniref:uncharacterized protein n=1 Tax=Clytia hemisphaerica TaxID=252671 RepID=UPI0034D7680C
MASTSDEIMDDFVLNFDTELPEELLSIENLELDDMNLDEDEEIQFDIEPIIVDEDIIQEADELELDIESESTNSEISIIFTSDTDVAIVKSYDELVEDKKETKDKPILHCKHCNKQYVIPKYLKDHEESCVSKSSKNLTEWRRNIQQQTFKFLENAVEVASKDRIFNLKKESIIHQLIKYLKSKLEEKDNTTTINSFKQFTVCMLQCIPDHPSKIESCTFKLEEVFSNKTIWTLWRTLFKDFPETKELRILLHYILQKLHKEIWNYRNNLEENRPETKKLELKLTLQEENILRYVAGYIPYVLLKKLEDRKESDSKTALLKAVFKIWTNVRANAFIKAWVTIIKLKKNSKTNIDDKGKPAQRKQLSG